MAVDQVEVDVLVGAPHLHCVVVLDVGCGWIGRTTRMERYVSPISIGHSSPRILQLSASQFHRIYWDEEQYLPQVRIDTSWFHLPAAE